MTLLNWLFKPHRPTGFRYAPQTTFARMAQRDYVRPNFTVPQTYAELMQLHREIGQRCAQKTQDGTEIIWRSSCIEILKRSTEDLARSNEVSPIVIRKIGENICRWKREMQPYPDPVPVLRFFRQLAFNFK